MSRSPAPARRPRCPSNESERGYADLARALARRRRPHESPPPSVLQSAGSFERSERGCESTGFHCLARELPDVMSTNFRTFSPPPPLSACLDLIYTIKFVQPSLLRPLFYDPPHPSDADIISGCSLRVGSIIDRLCREARKYCEMENHPSYPKPPLI